MNGDIELLKKDNSTNYARPPGGAWIERLKQLKAGNDIVSIIERAQ